MRDDLGKLLTVAFLGLVALLAILLLSAPIWISTEARAEVERLKAALAQAERDAEETQQVLDRTRRLAAEKLARVRAAWPKAFPFPETD